ncbi:MAG: NAD(P)H-hydrate dehydratase, partial [Bacteroidota bacterium]
SILSGFPDENNFLVVCGKGNNGGDGLVIARLLFQSRKKVRTFIIEYSEEASADFTINLQRLKECGADIFSVDSADDMDILKEEIIIDAIFGSGLSKPTGGLVKNIIRKMNESGNTIISIDVPSGLFMEDNSQNAGDGIVQATYTFTFQCPKLAFLFPENEKHTGKWQVLDIGLDKNFIAETDSKNFFVQKELVQNILQPRSKFTHKGNNGHALIVAGSHGKTGAAILCASSCLRSGAGLVTAYLPAASCDSMQAAFPEAMVLTDVEKNFISSVPSAGNYDAIAAGPGLGTEKATQNALKLLIQNAKTPMVLDADALNSISENKTWLSFLPPGSVLTPHPKEFERLFGKTENSYERVMLQKEMSFKYGCYIVLKGAYTSITTPGGNTFFNSTGNPGMATAGSGDVLTGIITGLMAQGYNGLEASVAGVYLHGLAGDFAAEEKSEYSVIASDIINSLGKAFLQLTSLNPK